MLGAFVRCDRQGMSGMQRDLGQDVLGSEKPYAKQLCADLNSWGPKTSFNSEESSEAFPRIF